jgi:hypothetical protein
VHVVDMRAPAQKFYRPRRVATRKLLSPRTAALFARADEMSGKSSAPLCFLGGIYADAHVMLSLYRRTRAWGQG